MSEPVAVVSMAGRFPGADDVSTLWENLCAERESITRFHPGDHGGPQVDPDMAADPAFVGAEGMLSDIAGFDAAHFGLSPRDAQVMDPQHRLCLESAWAAFDAAGYDPGSSCEPVGVFLASSISSYLVRNLLPDPTIRRNVGGLSLLTHNDKDYAATAVSHHLGLTGPSFAVGSACSSSLVAVHLACRSLQSYECDMALAGGVSLLVPHGQGYVYADDGVYSPDGRCAAFDDSAAGTVGGSGVGMVLLKRLSDAQRDGDRIHALVLGSAVNNDGGDKVGFTAPGFTGQSQVIAEAHAVAGISAESIGYVEAHGTGTRLGDTVEIAALTKAFRATTDRTEFCALGSIKTNIGHLDAAAGVAGMIKAVHAVRDGVVPASLHFRVPNSQIDFPATPFRVADRTMPWPSGSEPRRAGVSSFGVGGTNVHLVLESPPALGPRNGEPRSVQPLVVSARTSEGLHAATHALAADLRSKRDVELVDVAATLAGRAKFRYRRAVVGSEVGEAVQALERPSEPEPVNEGLPAVFVFPGQGSSYPGMARDLAERDITFRRHLDDCAAILAGHGVDLGAGLDCRPGTPDATRLGQPAQFAVEYSLARTLQEWGVVPRAMVGHSLGEYVAATLAGVFSVRDALGLVAARGRLQAELPPGRMLAISLSSDEVVPMLTRGQWLAVDSGPDQCVVAGSPLGMEEFEAGARAREVTVRRLSLPHAFHTPAVDVIADRFRDELARIDLAEPTSAYVSNLTGDWIDPSEARTPEYWVQHMRNTVRFREGLRRCVEDGPVAIGEVGPSGGLGRSVRGLAGSAQLPVVRFLPQPRGGDKPDEARAVATAVADLWSVGVAVDWDAYHREQGARRVTLSSTPLQRERYWVGPLPATADSSTSLADLVLPIQRSLALEDPTETRGVDDYPGLRESLEQLCVALAFRFFGRTLDLAGGGAEAVRADDLPDLLGVLPAFRPMVAFLLELLETAGVVQSDDGLRVASEPPEAVELAAEVRRAYPEFAGLVDLMVHCADSYSDALATPGGGLSVLYPDGEPHLLRRALGRDTVDHRAVTRLVGQVGDLMDALARRGSIRVLEVGVGQGNLTQHLVSRAASRLAYHATDVSRVVIDQVAVEAQERKLDFVTTGTFDIGIDPVEQGFGGGYDLICGLDVVHAAPDIVTSLGHLRGLLAPGGVLAVIETTSDDPWLSLIWGLSESWWTHTDIRRGHTPLMGESQWRDAMSSSGFAESLVLVPQDGPRDAALILGQASLGRKPTPDHPSLPSPRVDLEEWGYVAGWRHSVLPPRQPLAGRCLLLGTGALAGAVHDRLIAAGVEVVVAPEHFKGDEARSYEALLTSPEKDIEPPSMVVHTMALDDSTRRGRPATAETMDGAQRSGLHSLLTLVRALGELPGRSPVRIVMVTGGVQAVLGDDLSQPEHATVVAVAKVVPRENPWMSCTAVDVDSRASGTDVDWLAERVVDELAAARESTVVAYRGRRRFEPAYAPAPLRRLGDLSGPRPGGVYLVWGGLGGIGSSVAEFLGALPATVVIAGRRTFPDEAGWARHLAAHAPEDPTSVVIRRLQRIQSRGGEVAVMSADITDVAAVRAVVSEAERRFGPVTGVVHAAGVVDAGGVIQRRTIAETDAAMAAKVRGVAVLDEALGDRRLDFFALCSSIGTVVYKLKFGEVGYLAANEYVNAFAAHRSTRRPGITVAIAWTDWKDAGMWADAQSRLGERYGVPEGPQALVPADDVLGSISPADGVEVFRRVLSSDPGPQLVVSSLDLEALLARHAAFSTDDHLAATSRLSMLGSRMADSLSSSVPPANDVERIVASWFADLLGYDEVGRHDDFFALGGDSLVALRLLALVRSRFGVEVELARMLVAPTVAGLAELTAELAETTARPGHREVVL